MEINNLKQEIEKYKKQGVWWYYDESNPFEKRN